MLKKKKSSVRYSEVSLYIDAGNNMVPKRCDVSVMQCRFRLEVFGNKH